MRKIFLNLDTHDLVEDDFLRRGGDTVYPVDYADFDGYMPVTLTPQPAHQRDIETLSAEYDISNGVATQRWVITQKSDADKLIAINQRIIKTKLLVCNRLNQEAQEFGYTDLAMMQAVHQNQAEVNQLITRLQTAMDRIDTARSNASHDNLPNIDVILEEALAKSPN